MTTVQTDTGQVEPPADVGALTRRWFREVWADQGEAAVDAMMSSDAHGWIEGGFVKSPAEFKAALGQTSIQVIDMNPGDKKQF